MRTSNAISTVLLAALAAGASDLLSSRDQYVRVGVDHMWSADIPDDTLGGDGSFQFGTAYISLPGFRVFGKNVFMALDMEVTNRTISWDGDVVNDNPMQRYGLFAGITLIERERHRGSFLLGSGVATDFEQFGNRSWYLHVIYDHRFDISDKVDFGMGILLSYNLGEIRMPVNLLPSFTWRITPKTMLTAAWDNLTFEQQVFPRTSLFAVVRYDLSFFGIGDRNRYEYESVSIGGGVNVRVAANYFVRIRYLESLYRSDQLDRPGRDEPVWVSEGARGVGVSVVMAK